MRWLAQEAWLAFILAHELGHIFLGHIEHNGLLGDQRVDRRSNDAEEVEANTFAVE